MMSYSNGAGLCRHDGMIEMISDCLVQLFAVQHRDSQAWMSAAIHLHARPQSLGIHSCNSVPHSIKFCKLVNPYPYASKC